MSLLKETIKRTGRSPILRTSWSELDLAELRAEGAAKLEMAATRRPAQFDLHHSWPRLLDLITDPEIVSRLAELFEDDSFQLVETRLYPKAPGAASNWHIDINQLECFEPNLLNTDSDDFHSITTWLALDDVTEEMGALQAIHHKQVDLRKIVESRISQATDNTALDIKRRYQEACAQQAEQHRDYIETFPMKGGEFCMFDPRSLHTGGANRTKKFRLGMVLRYCANYVKVHPSFSKQGELRIIRIKNGKPVMPEKSFA